MTLLLGLSKSTCILAMTAINRKDGSLSKGELLAICNGSIG